MINEQVQTKVGKSKYDRIPCLSTGSEVETKKIFNGDDRFRAINYNHASVAMLNKNGYDIIKSVDGKRNVADITRHLLNGIKVSERQFRSLRKGVGDFFDNLYKHKIVYYRNEEPHYIIETTLMGKPEEVWLHLTNRCNLRCVTCFKDEKQLDKKDLSTEKILSIVDEISDLGVGYIAVSGGEPFLRPDALDILNYICVEKGIKVLLITNGTLLTKEMCQRLGRIRPNIVQVSLDGSTAEVNDKTRGKGAYEKTIQAIKWLLEENLDVRLYPTITRHNIHDLPNMKKLVNRLRPGFRHLAFARFHPTGRGLTNEMDLAVSDEEFVAAIKAMSESEFKQVEAGEEDPQNTFYAKYSNGVDLTRNLPTRVAYGARKINCGMGTATFSIEADGKVYPCQWLHFPEYVSGDLNKQSLTDIYFNSPIFRGFKNLRVDSKIEGCSDCNYKYFCGGGCRARAYYKDKNIAGRDNNCDTLYPNFHCGLWTDAVFNAD